MRRLPFQDRHVGGRALADALAHYADARDLIVLGLPRGGVPVAFEVAQALNAPLDIFMVRKLGLPDQEELAMGAIASGGAIVWNEDVLKYAQPPIARIESVIERERRELERREVAYRGDRPPATIHNHTVIVVDDGLATGASMRVAALAIREQEPTRLVIGVPVAARETCDEFRSEVDEIVCAETPRPFRAVGEWYADFSPTTDEEVRELLSRTRTEEGAAR